MRLSGNMRAANVRMGGWQRGPAGLDGELGYSGGISPANSSNLFQTF